MVESPKYERLKALMSLSAEPLGAEDLSEDTRVGDAHSDVGVAKSGSEDFVADLSVGLSQMKEGADGWMSSFIVDAGRHLDTIESTKAHHLTLREQMSKKVVESRNLSPVLIEPELEYLRHSDETVTIADPNVAAKAGAVEVTGRAYIAALEAQRNEEREAEADKILTQLNADAHAEKSSIYTPMDDFVPEAWRPAPAPEPAPDPGPQSGGGGYGRRRGMSGGLVPTVGAETVAGSGASGWTYPPAGELGSVSNPISDPADLVRYDLTTTPVNQRMTPNGPVGGHMPADVLNVNDPAWRAVPSAAGGGARIAGGVLVAGSAAGAAGAALSYGGGFAGIGGLASGASGSALRAVAPAGGVLRPSALPGGGVAGAVGGAGRGGGAGVVGRGGVAPVGSGAAGSAGDRGASAGGRGASGGVAGRGGVSAAGRGASGAGAVGRGGVAPVGSGASGTAGGRGGVAGGRATSGVTAVGRGASGGVAGRGGVAPVGSGGVGDRREKKGQVRRRAYDVVRVDALEERGAQMMGGAAGSADQLKPIARDADADW
ncbi:hypothetical protein O3669_04875 [Pauljensenia sp. 20925_1_34]|uniref:hypothetical protein n=1 Tax=Pauljensenia sp. 20925_1_34 TaxID=3003674 RepID=UPI00352E733D